MTADNVDRTVVTEEAAGTPAGGAGTGSPERSAVRTETETQRTTTARPHGSELTRRIVVLIFGIIQVLIILRIVLLLLNAREGNDLVSFLLNASQVFVVPFEGIFNTDALKSGGSILDVAAVAALVGWTVLEMIVLWAVGIFRREPA